MAALGRRIPCGRGRRLRCGMVVHPPQQRTGGARLVRQRRSAPSRPALQQQRAHRRRFGARRRPGAQRGSAGASRYQSPGTASSPGGCAGRGAARRGGPAAPRQPARGDRAGQGQSGVRQGRRGQRAPAIRAQEGVARQELRQPTGCRRGRGRRRRCGCAGRGQPEGARLGGRRPASGRHRPGRGAFARQRGPTCIPAPAARGCRAQSAARRCHPLAPDGARRDRVAAASGVLARDHRSEMGAYLRVRNEPWQGTHGHARLRDGRQLPRTTVRGMDRLRVAGRRIHAQDGGNRGAPHQPALRGARVRERSEQRPAARDTGHGAPAAEHRSNPANGRPMNGVATLPLVGRDIFKTFRRSTGEVVRALDGVSLEARRGTLTALVGPDGAGKTTLIRLMAGLMPPDSGTLKVLDLDVVAQPQAVQDRIGYMPQRFGLYEDLSVAENLDLYADLHGIDAAERARRYPRLLEMTALAPFTKRLAGRLSGGMKQKLGLACTLVRSPELILLDEPTVGVDPLSRRERAFVAEPPTGQTARGFQARLLQEPNVVDAVPEAGQVRIVRAAGAGSDWLRGPLRDAKVKPVPPRFEDAFMVLLRQAVEDRAASIAQLGESHAQHDDGVVVEVRDLVRRFGTFTAVDHVTFDVRRGEIFGLLGPNGAGKTTTVRMLCGLLPASGGTLQVAGTDLRYARASARELIGYVAQKFSLYGQLSVMENLEFFASAYGLRAGRKRDRIDWAMQQFELHPVAKLASGQLPGGYKQRLAMAAALLHEPQILFLDEPTSGADPLARREFWQRITLLAESGVTVIVTTHFMEEAEYCDRVAILDAGRILAQGTPAEIRARGRAEAGRQPDMEDAFIAIVQEARVEEMKGAA